MLPKSVSQVLSSLQDIKNTLVIQVLAKLGIPVASRRNVEVTLDLVALETAVDATRVFGRASLELGRLGELAVAAAHFAQHMARMRIFLFALEPARRLALHLHIDRPDFLPALLAQQPHQPLAIPHVPVGRVAVQHRCRENPVPRGILHVDVQVLAPHVHYRIQVDL